MEVDRIICGDCLEVLRSFPDNSIDAVVTDPPYGLNEIKDLPGLLRAWLEGEDGSEWQTKGFMGKGWDKVPPPSVWREVLRVMKPGAYILCFAGCRTVDLMGISLRLAGFEDNNLLAWLQGQGFPKATDVGRQLEKMGRASHGSAETQACHAITARPSTSWDGWKYGKQALKPAMEPILLMQKRFEKGLAGYQNVLKWGTGALNIEACRIPTNWAADPTRRGWQGKRSKTWDKMPGQYVGTLDGPKPLPHSAGRFPANVLLERTCIPILRLINSREGVLSPEQRRIIEEYYDHYSVPRMWKRVPDVPEQGKERAQEILFQGMLLQEPKQEDEGQESPNVREEAQTRVYRKDETSETRAREKGEGTSAIQGILDEQRLQVRQHTRSSAGTERDCTGDGSRGAFRHRGTSAGDGTEIRKTAETGRSRPSRQRHKKRQSPGESGPEGQFHTQERTLGTGKNGKRTKSGEREIKVLACDIPEKWMRYFEPTGYSVISPHSSAEVLDEQSFERGIHSAGSYLEKAPEHWGLSYNATSYGFGGRARLARYGDSGGASRFFYVAKASTKERNAGLDERNLHPTVKPIELMRYLVRLITPPNGIVLDPFCGTGTTCIAAMLEGFHYIGIDFEPEYCEWAEKRIVWYRAHPPREKSEKINERRRKRSNTPVFGN